MFFKPYYMLARKFFLVHPFSYFLASCILERAMRSNIVRVQPHYFHFFSDIYVGPLANMHFNVCQNLSCDPSNCISCHARCSWQDALFCSRGLDPNRTLFASAWGDLGSLSWTPSAPASLNTGAHNQLTVSDGYKMAFRGQFQELACR